MSTLSSMSLSKDSSAASVGAGIKWLDVYQYLKGSGVQVASGRNGNVGVGGLLLGGGISHFTTRVGWACDQVLNYQVVLANGTLINANEDNYADLFVALKARGNNFGIVTRFDLQTFQQGKISTITITYNVSQRAKLFEAFTNLLDSSTYDPLASFVTTLVHSSTSKSWSLKSSAAYTKPFTNPEVFDKLSTIPQETVISNITTLEVIIEEEDTPPL
ncbi:hypothetical protein HG530_001662 [Fusarium avenaceum]|nr:hypothetical protein HG530_001662 [Fusarium avenaceum]